MVSAQPFPLNPNSGHHAQAFSELLHVGAPNIGDRQAFHDLVDEIFDRRWLTNRGELVQRFEARLADYLSVKHCITMCNGTSALEIAIRALGLSGEVIMPSLTFVATAHALQWQQITPVFCDIDPNTYNIDPNKVEQLITPKTTAIMGVHLYSRPCDIAHLQEIADRNGLHLLFDAAHAFGCSYQGHMMGHFGRCEVFSFHATKAFNTFEGGAVTTDDDELAETMRLMQNFGFSGQDEVTHIGVNGKMSEICAAMGLVNLDAYPRFVEKNQRNYHSYQQGFASIDGVKLIDYDAEEHNNWHYVMIELEADYPLSRDQLLQTLSDHNIRARRYFWPGCHRQEPYRSLQPNAHVLLPETEAVAARLLALPTGMAMSQSQIETIIELIRHP